MTQLLGNYPLEAIPTLEKPFYTRVCVLITETTAESGTRGPPAEGALLALWDECYKVCALMLKMGTNTISRRQNVSPYGSM